MNAGEIIPSVFKGDFKAKGLSKASFNYGERYSILLIE